MSKNTSAHSIVGRKIPPASRNSTMLAAASSYPKIQPRGFYSEVLAPDAERRLGVSNFDVYLTFSDGSVVEE